MTAEELIKASLRLCGIGSPAASQLTTGLEALNLMLGLWGAEKLMIPYNTRENFTLTSGKSTYTIGSSDSADFNTGRPQRIEGAFIRDSSDSDYLLDVSMAEQDYDEISYKPVAGRPSRLFYYTSYPLGKIYFDSVPSLAEILYLSSWKHLTKIANLADSVSLPEEYEKAIKFNLAVDLAPEHDAVLDKTVINQANLSKTIIENLRPYPTKEATFDRAIVRDLVR